ncbi:tRNA-specific adenosine deaminase [Streptomyces vinaceus]|uniref:hypothetical protein n=1 Tax=Streptomyces vinaceus TaxID=1960 RepID=UPI0036B499B4
MTGKGPAPGPPQPPSGPAVQTGLPPFLALALKQAARSECRYKVGAVLAKGGRVLSHASNRRRNSPWVDFKNATFHAEVALLRRYCPPPGAVVYVARIDRRGQPALARPCTRCQQVLANHGITLVHYTARHGHATLRIPLDEADF